MIFDLKNLVYFKDNNTYYIPCVIEWEDGRMERLVLNDNHLRDKHACVWFDIIPSFSKPLIEVNNKISLAPCYIIKKVLDPTTSTINFVVSLKNDGLIKFNVNNNDIVVYEDFIEYFNSFLATHNDTTQKDVPNNV